MSIIILLQSNLIAGDRELESVFKQNGIEGTIVISNLEGTETYIHNEKRAEKRFLPASTFKILNSLIALNEKIIENHNEIIKWDGTDKGWHHWNKDQTLSTALPISCVWFYQELANRIGNDRYLKHLTKVKYGNEKTGPDLATFWLNGELRISTLEQIDFLRKLYKKELPYSHKHMKLIKNLLVVQSKPNLTVRAKTGWAMQIKKQHGWYVGWVETTTETWFFATNIQINSTKDAIYREKITFQALEIKEIL